MARQNPRPFGPLRRSDLPEQFTPDTLRSLPVGTLRRLRDPRNGVLTASEQEQFDAALTELMTEAAQRLQGQFAGQDWSQVGRGRARRGGPGARREQQAMERLVRRIGTQVDLAEQLAPGVDWSFVPTDVDAPEDSDATERSSTVDDDRTIHELESDLGEQVELVAMMGELADISRRTLALEQQRELSNTRGLFFGFLVSVAVIAAGWAPLVMATSEQRRAIVFLTLVTCLVAGAVYAAVSSRQRHDEDAKG